MRKSVLAFAFAALAATSSWAATVEVVTGDVNVGKGGGFQKVVNLTDAQTGDIVTVEKGGSVNIVFSDGCTIRLGDPAKRTVLRIPATCKAGIEPLLPAPNSILTGALIAGGIAGGVILATSGSDSSKAASP